MNPQTITESNTKNVPITVPQNPISCSPLFLNDEDIIEQTGTAIRDQLDPSTDDASPLFFIQEANVSFNRMSYRHHIDLERMPFLRVLQEKNTPGCTCGTL